MKEKRLRRKIKRRRQRGKVKSSRRKPRDSSDPSSDSSSSSGTTSTSSTTSSTDSSSAGSGSSDDVDGYDGSSSSSEDEGVYRFVKPRARKDKRVTMVYGGALEKDPKPPYLYLKHGDAGSKTVFRVKYVKYVKQHECMWTRNGS